MRCEKNNNLKVQRPIYFARTFYTAVCHYIHTAPCPVHTYIWWAGDGYVAIICSQVSQEPHGKFYTTCDRGRMGIVHDCLFCRGDVTNEKPVSDFQSFATNNHVSDTSEPTRPRITMARLCRNY